ncbi:Helicase associated domain protein [Streptomyces sp. OfavH-34-F]|uniref:DEAD/DEAH box helicase n=1 Tax=Streptomyces sp. OfavH-34-F TaxID=2917760 RepID=UPI001EF1D1E8|nr:DEAD/DEAH box helicase [Streptomyces sp. OfavH-34-F]MCG7522879.1 Helicase associated domain protein [Streptomyces sp. OfavH-34-F]
MATATLTPPARPRLRLRPHQARAVHSAATALRHGPRTTVISACGTGKTVIAARVAREIVRHGHQLVLVPTVELLGQTIAEWREAGHEGPVMAMCHRRPKVPGEHIPASTHPGFLAAWVQDNPDGTVFGLYQSLDKIQKAHRKFRLGPWALISADEAHRTSGYINKSWAAVHHDRLVPAGRRAYYTATPRIWSAGDADDPELVASMEDPALYGETSFRLPLAEAIDIELLADYRVVVLEVHEKDLRARLGLAENADAAELRRAAVQVAVLRAMAQLDLKRVVSFHHRVADAHDFADTFQATARHLAALDDSGTTFPDPDSLWAAGIDGLMSVDVRHALLGKFDGRPEDGTAPYPRTLIANARLLGEGVNIPAIDCVVFADVKDSIVDTVQAVGRALRQKPGAGKKATILVPLFVAPQQDPDDLLNSPVYKPLWKVLQALRAHDDRLADRLAVPQTHTERAPDQDEPEAETTEEPRLVMDREFPDDTLALALRLRVLHPREAAWQRGMAAAERYFAEHGHLDVPQLYDDETGFALGRWINYARQMYAGKRLSPLRIKALEAIGMIWDLRKQATERGLAHARLYVEHHGHLAVPADEMIGDYAFGRWLVNRRRSARDRAARGLEPDPVEVALSDLYPWWNPVWPITWQREYVTALRYQQAGVALEDLPRDFVTDDTEPLGEWIYQQAIAFDQLHPDQVQLLLQIGIAAVEPVQAALAPTGRQLRQQRQLDDGLAAVAAFRAQHGHDVPIRQRDTVVIDGEVVRVGQFINNLRKRLDRLTPEQLEQVTAAGLVPAAA